jgi:hypothetical protein
MATKTTLDIPDLISLICDLRKEAYPFERHLALLSFGLWVIEPQDAAFLSHGRLIGAAQLVQSKIRSQPSTSAQRRFVEIDFSNEAVTSTLISPAIIGPLRDEVELRQSEYDLVSGIVEILISAPVPKDTAKRPSLNKAIHFILNGGLGSGYKASPATIKKQWVRYLTRTPFLLAEEQMELGVIGAAPDQKDWLKSTERVLKRTSLLREFFGLARGIQSDLISKLDPVSRKRFQFVEIPKAIEPVECEWDEFTPEQCKIYNRYKAPRYDKT